MNPSPKEAPQFDLPLSPSEQLPPAGEGKEPAQKPERLAAAPERAASPPPIMPSIGATAASPSITQQKGGQGDDNSTTDSTKKLLLEDEDLIEKEWVNKAKRIVENTRNDPHKQSEELTVVKADYMKKRYGKTIKLK